MDEWAGPRTLPTDLLAVAHPCPLDACDNGILLPFAESLLAAVFFLITPVLLSLHSFAPSTRLS